MKWMLIAIAMNVPMPTGIVFDSLPECLKAEQAMRQAWADANNEAVKAGAQRDTLGFLRSQMGRGTCIPSK